MSSRKGIKEKFKRSIGQGSILLLVGLALSYPLYNVIENDSIMRRIITVEIVLGMFFLNKIIVNIFFGDNSSFFSRNSLIISVVWTIAIGACLIIGVVRTYGNTGLKMNRSEGVGDLKTSREQIQLELLEDNGKKNAESGESASWHCVTEDKYGSNGLISQLVNYQYDDNGTLTKKIFYDDEGKIEKYEDYIYNNRGNLIKVEVYKPDDTDKKRRYVYYEFDSDNVIYEYDNQDRCISKKIIRNSIPDYIRYIYADRGEDVLVKTEEYGDGEIYCINEYNYKDDQLVKVNITYMENGKVDHMYEDSYTYEYDGDGNLTKQIISGVADYVTYYDKNGNIIKDEKWVGSELYYYNEYSYEYF